MHDHNPLEDRDAAPSKPEAVRKPIAPALERLRAGSRDGTVAADLPAARDARIGPDATSEIEGEGETEVDGVEHESLDARDETRLRECRLRRVSLMSRRRFGRPPRSSEPTNGR